MEVNKISNSPNFQAKIIVGDSRIQKFIKSSYMANSRKMNDLLDSFNDSNKNQLVTLNIRKMFKDGADYMIARNGITGKDSGVILDNAEIITPNNRNAFYTLIKRIFDDKSFWEKPILDAKFDAASKEVKIEHDVFNLDK
jgi:hypothetical protein